MARRNMKNGHAGNRTIFWGIPLSVLVAALAMVYLSLFNTCENIGRQIKKLENERAELHKRVVNEERNWEIARAPGNMVQLMENHGIVMTWPEEKNIIRLSMSGSEEPAQYAFQGGFARRD